MIISKDTNSIDAYIDGALAGTTPNAAGKNYNSPSYRIGFDWETNHQGNGGRTHGLDFDLSVFRVYNIKLPGNSLYSSQPIYNSSIVLLSSHDSLVNAGFTLNDAINYFAPLANMGWWSDGRETIPGFTNGTWDYTQETWWDSRFPHASCFFAGTSGVGIISLNITKGGTYIFIVGSAQFHRDTGVGYHTQYNSHNEVQLLLNDQQLWISDSNNNSLQKAVQFNANVGDVVTLRENFGMALIYGYEFIPPAY